MGRNLLKKVSDATSDREEQITSIDSDGNGQKSKTKLVSDLAEFSIINEWKYFSRRREKTTQNRLKCLKF